jgi:hypothetical protein
MISQIPKKRGRKPERDLDENQYHHERCMLLVHLLEQTVKNKGNEEKTDHCDKSVHNVDIEERLRSENVSGCRSGVSSHQQFARSIYEIKDAGDYHEQVKESRDSCCLFG